MFENSLRDAARKLRLAAKIVLVLGLIAAVVIIALAGVRVAMMHQDVADVKALAADHPEFEAVLYNGADAQALVDTIADLKKMKDVGVKLEQNQILRSDVLSALQVIEALPNVKVIAPTATPTPVSAAKAAATATPVVTQPAEGETEGEAPAATPAPTAAPAGTAVPAMIVNPAYQHVMDLNPDAVAYASAMATTGSDKELNAWSVSEVLKSVAQAALVLVLSWVLALYIYGWHVPMQRVSEKGVFEKLLGNTGAKLQKIARVEVVLSILGGILTAIIVLVNTLGILGVVLALLLGVLAGVAFGIVGWFVAVCTQNWGEAASFWKDAYSRKILPGEFMEDDK